MKYNDNGEIKNIIIKSGDTLPIGTEVDYDGEAIPAGWQEVEEKEKVLWNNPAPINAFAGQTITLNDNINNYKYYEILYLLVNNGVASKSTGKIRVSNNSYMDYVGGSGEVLGFKREINAKTNNTISFSDAYRINTNAVENSRCIPLIIIGYK